MPVSEMFVFSMMDVMLATLSSDELLSFAHEVGIDKQLSDWGKTLIEIQAVLRDADEKKLSNTAVEHWVRELEVLAYEMDDLLDKIATEALSRKMMMMTMREKKKKKSDQATTSTSTSTSSSKKVMINFIIPTFCCTSFNLPSLMFGHKMRSQIEDISTRLQDIVNLKNGLDLKEIVTVKSERRRPRERMPSSSWVNSGSDVFGRENDKRAIINMLLKDDHEEANPEVFSVIPICGMGGVGKTTLAQLVYNDAKLKDFFDFKVWVCVSEEFDVFMLTKMILQALTADHLEIKNLNILQVSLKEKLSNKKFLLVLDDVWNVNYEKWDILLRPLRAGAPGSKIIVTTRSEHVASIMTSVQPYTLHVLKNVDCLHILAQHALGTMDFDAHPSLKVFGDAFVRKCQGMPLAAKVLGGLLRTELSPKYWKEILDSEIWNTPQDQLDILPILRLSYNYLPSHMKRLLAYCSIFPKDYEFDMDELVLLWMAVGLLQKPEDGTPMEELGYKYFNELLFCSFFSRSSGSESRFVMHDLVNDLAQVIAGKMCFRLESNIRDSEQYDVSEKARYSSFIRKKYEVLENFKAFHGLKALQMFLPLPIFIPDWQEFYLCNGVLNDLLPRLQCVRVLSLSGYSISEIPKSIGDLKQLRYLNLSETLIKWLPESVSNLYHLQTLLLRRCRRLTKLPMGIGKLLNLRHLDCMDTNQLREMPPGIGKLTSLRTLTKIILGKDNGIRELASLSDIRGRLTMEGLHTVTVTNIQDAREANLLSKHGLDELVMEWSCSFYDSQTRSLEKEVLEVLQPPSSLKKLKLILYGGTEFPRWIGDSSFSNMVDLELRNCRQCTGLPSLGQLPLLKKLHIHGIDRVKIVGIEFLYGAGCPDTVAFPSLESLSFEEMPDWEEWSTLAGVNVFPCLHELIISDCPSLINISLSRLPSLRVLKLNACPEVVLRCIVGFASLTSLTIQGISGLAQLQTETILFLGALAVLEIKQCREMTSLWLDECSCKQRALFQSLESLSLEDCPKLEKLPDGLNRLTSLQTFRIDNCPRFMCFPITGLPPMLRSLKIRNCKALGAPAYDYAGMVMHSNCKVIKSGNDGEETNNEHSESFSHLEICLIEDCPYLTSFSIGSFPSTLKELCIIDCMKLERDVEDSLHNCVSSLDRLTINGWRNFKTFPAHFVSFGRLTELNIQRCPDLESFPKSGFPSNLRRLAICNCVKLKSLPSQMETLKSLIYLDLYGCPSLDSFPQGGFPPNLKELTLGDIGVCMSKWDLQGFDSLHFFGIQGECKKLVNFPGECQLPTSLRRLKVNGPVNLKSLQNLPSLEELSVWDCPKLRSLPKTTLSSLSYLDIWRCPLLEKRCLKEKGYQKLLAQIPCVMLDCMNIHRQ